MVTNIGKIEEILQTDIVLKGILTNPSYQNQYPMLK